MNRKLLGLLAAAGMLFAASCSTDTTTAEPLAPDEEELVTVEFTVATEVSPATRADGYVHYPQAGEFPQISDGSKAKKLIYAVYDSAGNLLKKFGEDAAQDGIGVGQTVVDDVNQFPYSFKLTLVRGQEYSIAFWAQNSDCQAFNTLDLRAVTVDYKSANPNNDELRDAFCKTETFTVSSATASRYIVLTRPFAQINMGVPKSEYEALINSGFRFTQSKIHLENVATELDVVDNTVNSDPDKRQAITYDFAPIPAYINYDEIPTPEQLEADFTDNPGKEQFLKIDLDHDKAIAGYGEQNGEGKDETYHYLSMCYVLPADRVDGTSTYSTTLDRVEITLRPEMEGQNDVTFSLTQVPIQRNWRTNIFGNLLTSEIEFIVDLYPDFSGDYNYPDWSCIYEGVTYDAFQDCLLISNGAGLQWLADATNGKWLTKEDYTFADHPEYSADLFLEAAKLEQWPSDGFFHFKDVTIKLQNDIDWATYAEISGLSATRGEYSFEPIGFGAEDVFRNNLNSGQYFNGTFDGCNHTVSNVKTVRPSDNSDDHSFGFFSYIGRNARVKNLRLKNIDIEGHYKTGGITGTVYSHYDALYHDEETVISNCYVDGGTITVTSRYTGSEYDDGNNVGGIAGIFYNSGVIEDCFVRNVTIRAFRALGGILGQVGGDYLADKVTLRNNKVYNVTLISDQFQEYSAEKGYEIANVFVAKDTVGGIRYEDATDSEKFGSNTEGDNKIYAFSHATLKESDPNYKFVADQEGKRFTDIGKSDVLSDPPLDIFPRLVHYSDYVHFSASILGGPSAWKSYINDTDYKGTPDKSSGRVGLFVGELTIDGDTDGNEETIDNHTITVSDVDNDGDCALYVWKWATIKNITIHGSGYANEAICLAPESGKTILLDNVYAYDAETVLADEGNGNGSTLTITDSNFRGNVTYSNGYAAVSFTNTIFDSSTKNEADNKLTVGNDTTFEGCTFKAPYTIEIAGSASATFTECYAIVNGKETKLPIEATSGTVKITIDDQGEPQVNYE